MVNNTCFEKQAQNCAVFESELSCAICPQNYFLQKEDGLTNCRESDIFNCIEISTLDQFTCEKCLGDFFVNENSLCELVAPLIEGCLEYDSMNTCSECEKGYVLTLDKICLEE